ncbi:MAG: hypothetical protein WDN45_13305 [Caulobacteraceae bacterium]
MADGTAPFIDTAQRPDPARLERQLAMLDALAAAGVQAAREVGRQAEAQQSSAAEISLAYARVSRAVRLAILLQTQLVEEAQTRQARIRKAVEDAEDLKGETRKARVERIVERLALQAHPHDEEQLDRIVREAGERLDDMDLYGDLLQRPLSELVARICKDLDLAPDWTALAQELWAAEEMQSGEVGEPLQGLGAASPASGGGGPRSGGEGAPQPLPPKAPSRSTTLDGFP